MELDVHLGVFVEVRRTWPFSKRREHLAQPAISSSVALWVISRAAMLSSAAHAVIISITSRLVLRTT